MVIFRKLFIEHLLGEIMKRKVVLHGPSTLTISLPLRWVKQWNVQKGDELEVEETPRALQVRLDKELPLQKKELNVGTYKRLDKTLVTSCYRQGYDEITLSSQNENLNALQHLLTTDLIGFEIIKQTRETTLIKDLTGNKPHSFDPMLRRLWLLVLNLAEESYQALRTKEPEELQRVIAMDQNINKFSNYCLRLLTKTQPVLPPKSFSLFYLIKRLEEIADNYKGLCQAYILHPQKMQDSFFDFFSTTNSFLTSFYHLFYAYDEKKIETLFTQTNLLLEKLLDSQDKLSGYLFSVTKAIHDLLSSLVELHL